MTVRSSVVLPAPLRPIRPANSPAPTPRLTPRRMATGPIDTETFSSRSTYVLSDHVAAHLIGAQHCLRRPIGNDASIVERDNAAGVARDDVHIVLNEKHGYALAAHRAHDEVHDAEFFLGGHSAGGLIEQQELGPRDERHRHVEELAD